MEFITKDELEIPSNASEIRQWVENKIKETVVSKDAKHVVRFLSLVGPLEHIWNSNVHFL